MAITPTETEKLPLLRARVAESHKGNYGRVLIAAGSVFMPGAAALAARAAYRSGAGLVTVLTDAPQIASISAAVVEAIFTDWADVGAALARGDELPYEAILVGPGLGTHDRGRLVLDLISAANVPTIIDADALNLIARDNVKLAKRQDRIWTPHPGEFHRLTGTKPRSDAERLKGARRFVEDRGGVIILKGHRTVILTSDRYAINQTGNPGMATAGSGDVLAGALAALVGQGYAPFEAAQMASHLHGLAGDLAAAALGEVPLTASDLIDMLPAAFRRYAEETDCGPNVSSGAR